jgi:hypothetical protein
MPGSNATSDPKAGSLESDGLEGNACATRQKTAEHFAECGKTCRSASRRGSPFVFGMETENLEGNFPDPFRRIAGRRTGHEGVDRWRRAGVPFPAPIVADCNGFPSKRNAPKHIFHS